MLFYVFGTIFFVAGMFGYINQDHNLGFDNGEKAAAGWMVGYHNAIRESCRNGKLSCATAAGVATVLPRDPTYQPTYLLKGDGNALWLGASTVSYGTMLVTFYELTPDPGVPSRGRNLSLATVGARLYDATADMQDGTDLWTGQYSAAAGAVVLSNRFTAQATTAAGFDPVHSESAGVGPLANRVIPVSLGGVPIPDGSPVLVSPVPCVAGAGQCLGADVTPAGLASPSTTPELTAPGGNPLTIPTGSVPGTPPSPGGGSWDPGLGGLGTTTPRTINPVIVTNGDCPP